MSTLATVAQFVALILQRFGRVPLVVILLWTVTLWWGERTVFQKSASACRWHLWESWPADANPHHVLFVADPQLVDPHTYPGRPWPLSTLTVLYTDLYMRRTYSYLLDLVQPHTTIFLGDLFDGGREWAALDYESPEDRYRGYDTTFWLKEYNRFMNMFIGGWYDNNWDEELTGEGRKIVVSLPGNHDLGFAGGINENVRNRFEAHFGPTNRIDIFGNHSFVSLDTVSLSAMDQVDPQTGSSGAGDGTNEDTKHMEIWKPVEEFLIDAKRRRAKAVQRRYQYLKTSSEPESLVSRDEAEPKASSQDRSGQGLKSAADASVPSSNFPTVLLTHVPLFRTQDVTCGPLREHGNAIPLSAGYQYQNVLTPAISKDIVDHLDAEQITMVYSGDDHDYCEVEHGEFTGQIKEITVKSMSWAMGVRKPGVQLASLWNPIDMDAIARGEAPTSTPRQTVQNHLCLLPDQLGIFITYAQILGLTILILLVRAIAHNPSNTYVQLATSPTEKDKSQPLLPLTRKLTPPSSPYLGPTTDSTFVPTSTHIHSHAARSRSNGGSKVSNSSYGNYPSSSSPSTPPKSDPFQLPPGDTDDWGMPKGTQSKSQSEPQSFSLTSIIPFSSHDYPKIHAGITHIENIVLMIITPASTKAGEFIRSLNLVAGPVLIFYFWLLWNG